mgnify:CR=1 FL=1
MRIAFKILFTLLFVAVVPVAVSGVTSLWLAREAVTATELEKLSNEAKHLAELSENTILDGVADLTQSSVLGLHRLSADELQAALWIIYREDVRRNAVALLEVGTDGATGEKVASVVDLVYQETVANQPGLAGHQPFAEKHLDAFLSNAPVMEALAAGKAVSVAYADKERKLPLISMAVAVEGPLRATGPAQWLIAVEFSLADLNKRYTETLDEGMRAFFVDLDGKAVCHSDPALAYARTSLADHAAVQQLATFDGPLLGSLPQPTVDDRFAAWSRVSRLAGEGGKTWGVVVERDRKDVLQRVEELVPRTAFWVGTALIMALLSGVFLSRGIAGPLEMLSTVVTRFGGGDAEARSSVRSSDEIGTLARSFNDMADAIKDRDDELRSFNDQLQQKVDERTKELRDTQDQLLTSHKMAAVGELGAGVAHEINNPSSLLLLNLPILKDVYQDAEDILEAHYQEHGDFLIGGLAYSRMRDEIPPMLDDMLTGTHRIRRIVDDLRDFARQEPTELSETVDLNDVVATAIRLVDNTISKSTHHFNVEYAENLPCFEGNAQRIEQVVINLIINACQALENRDKGVSVRTFYDPSDQTIGLEVIDQGCGIEQENLNRLIDPFFTTKREQGGTGLGLSVSSGIVQAHGGLLQFASTPGEGTRVTLLLPV